jgi:hypothetical protein
MDLIEKQEKISKLNSSDAEWFPSWMLDIETRAMSTGLESFLTTTLYDKLIEAEDEVRDSHPQILQSRLRARLQILPDTPLSEDQEEQIERQLITLVDRAKIDTKRDHARIFSTITGALGRDLRIQSGHIRDASELIKFITDRFKSIQVDRTVAVRNKFNTLMLTDKEKFGTFIDEFIKLSHEMSILKISMTDTELASRLMAKVNEPLLTSSIEEDFMQLPGNDGKEVTMDNAVCQLKRYYSNKHKSQAEMDLTLALQKSNTAKPKDGPKDPHAVLQTQTQGKQKRFVPKNREQRNTPHREKRRDKQQNQKGRKGEDGNNSSDDQPKKVECWDCGGEHRRGSEECPEPSWKVRQDRKKRATKEQDDTGHANMAAYEDGGIINEPNVLFAPNQYSNTYLDSGASDYLTGDNKYLVNYRVLDDCERTRFRTAKKGKFVCTYGVGDLYVWSELGKGKRILLKLNDVKYVPGLQSTLISEGKLQQHGYHVIKSANDTTCRVVRGKDEKLVIVSKRVRDVYPIDFKFHKVEKENNTDDLVDDNVAMLARLPGEETVELGALHEEKIFKEKESESALIADARPSDILMQTHLRLAHAGVNRVIEHLRINDPKFDSVKINKLRSEFFCIGCAESATKERPHIGKIPTGEDAGDVIYTDLIGPFPDSFGRARFAVFFRDSKTKYTEGFALSTKDRTLDALKVFVPNALSAGIKIKCLYSDKGGEFTSAEFRQYCESKGINQQYISTESPQANGSIESYNGVIQTAMRANLSLAQKVNSVAKVGARFWADSLRHAVMARNCISTRKDPVSPFEKWFGNKPDLNRLRAFGCPAYVLLRKRLRTKTGPRAAVGLLVGYTRDLSAWRIFVPEYGGSGVILPDERNVYFNEIPIIHVACSPGGQIPIASGLDYPIDAHCLGNQGGSLSEIVNPNVDNKNSEYEKSDSDIDFELGTDDESIGTNNDGRNLRKTARVN